MSDHDLSTPHQLELLEAELLQFPQVSCPVVHHFGPNIYIREVTIPAGTLAIGHAQRFEHLNILLKGSVAMVVDGQVKIVSAPLIFTGKPGRKCGYALEDTVWQNVYSTSETDVEKLEAHFLDKSSTWEEHQSEIVALATAVHEVDRQDYRQLLRELNWTEDMVQSQVQNIEDQISCTSAIYRVASSPIHGQGIFATSPISVGEVIGIARIDNLRTALGRYTNHSKHPNAEFRVTEHGDIDLVALCDIQGCIGGNHGEEVTVDYRHTLTLSGVYL